MAWKRFRGGIHPLGKQREGKGSTFDLPIEDFPAPDRLILPMLQHIGEPCEPVVKKGDYVRVGDVIGKPGRSGVPIHASVSGEVEDVNLWSHTSGSRHSAVYLRNDHRYELLPSIVSAGDVGAFSQREIAEHLQAGGLVGLGGATFPSHVKLLPRNPIDTLIINGVECEPMLTADHRVMLEEADALYDGICILQSALGAQRVVLGMEENQADVADALRLKLRGIEIAVLPIKYPQGGEKQLIYAITGRKVPKGGLPSDVGCANFNAQTAVSASKILRTGVPLIERVITVTGPAIAKPANLRVRLGTQVQDILEYCGVRGTPVKIILGGPMMGQTIFQMSTPITKGISGIVVQDVPNICPDNPTNCIHCGACVRVCPMGLAPWIISGYGEQRNWHKCDENNARSCIECGCCSYICPAHRPLTPYCRLAKKEIALLQAQGKRGNA